MLKIIKNKKSFTIEPLIIIICFIVFAFVSLIFYILFGLASKVAVYDVKLGSNMSNTYYDYYLMNYLRAPVEVDGNKMIIADLIVLWYNNKEKYESILTEKSKEMIDKWEHEFINPVTKNKRIEAYHLTIYSKKQIIGESPNIILRVSSNSFNSGYCVKDQYGRCEDLTGIYIPLSGLNTIYAVLWVSEEAKKT
ncbi:MAG: hypothetical protein ABIH64_00460 [Nanoarchaeota archaeon]